MKTRTDYDIDIICSAFTYDDNTGIIKWRIPTGRGKSGEIAGGVNACGYRRITLLGRQYAAHRLAWILFYKSPPPEVVDHINGDTTDNRITNLRDGSSGVNQQNLKRPHSRNMSSRYLGVSKFAGRWRAKIYNAGKYYFLGYFETEEMARDAYLSAKREIHSGCEI